VGSNPTFGSTRSSVSRQDEARDVEVRRSVTTDPTTMPLEPSGARSGGFRMDDATAWYAWYKRAGGRELRALAMDVWDPIGVAGIGQARNEYDAYLGQVAHRLRRGASADEIAAYLASIRTERIKLDANPAADERAALAMAEWYERSQRRPQP
jgi:hypothetical protein